MKNLKIIFLLLICFTLNSSIYSNDQVLPGQNAEKIVIEETVNPWPHFLGPNRDVKSPEKNINFNWTKKKPKVLWSIDMDDDGYAGPSVADGKLFIINREGNQDVVCAYTASTGKKLWDFKYKDPGYSRYGFARTTPTYDEGYLYTLSRNGHLHCLDANTGKKIWYVNMEDEFNADLPRWQMSIAPVIDGDRLLVCPGSDKNIYALNKKTGKLILKLGNDEGISYVMPVITKINGQKQYLFFAPNKLLGINPSNGNVIWSYDWESRYGIKVAQPLVLDDKRIFITTGYRKGCAMIEVKGKKVRELWINKDMQAHMSTPIYHNGYIFGNSDPDHLVCLDPADGKVMWREKGFEKGPILLVDNLILALNGQEGDLVALKATHKKYKELSRFIPLGGRSWSPLALSDKKLYVRNREKLVCLDMTK